MMLGWAIFLIVLAAVLLVMELFLPTMGMLGVGAVLSGLGGLTLLYLYNTTAGLIGTAVLVVAVPVVFVGMLRAWPHTPIGRRLTLSAELQGKAPGREPTRDGVEASELLGEVGLAVSPLRPVGTCRFGERRVECISITGMIEPGTRVQVTAVDGIEVRVKALPRNAAV